MHEVYEGKMRNSLSGYEIVQLMPSGTPKSIKCNPVGRKSYTEMEVPGLGKRYVRFAGSGHCDLYHDCFT